MTSVGPSGTRHVLARRPLIKFCHMPFMCRTTPHPHPHPVRPVHLQLGQGLQRGPWLPAKAGWPSGRSSPRTTLASARVAHSAQQGSAQSSLDVERFWDFPQPGRMSPLGSNPHVSRFLLRGLGAASCAQGQRYTYVHPLRACIRTYRRTYVRPARVIIICQQTKLHCRYVHVRVYVHVYVYAYG